MKKLLVIFLFMMISAVHAEDKSGTLTVSVKPFKKQEGTLRIAIFNKKEGFLHKPFKVQKKDVTASTMEIEFKELPYGEYAVTLFQDLNQNGKLDMTLFVPNEPWGLSNNVSPMFGPPSFDDTKFVLNQPKKTIEIQVK